jgi:predicted dehydrogenase
VNAARRLFRAEPVAASFRARFREGDDGVDESAAGWLDFGDGRLAQISCSFTSAFAQGLDVVGAEGSAALDRPWLSVDTETEIVTRRGYERSARSFPPDNAYVTMVEHFMRCARDPEHDAWPAEDGLAQAAAMAGALESARSGGAVWTAS